MKFLHQHRKDIINLILQYGWDEQEFAFVKKKGRIHIIHQSSQKYFSYFRKKETGINPTTLQWEHSSYFKYQKNSHPEQIVKSWDLVKQKMEQWLLDLAKN